MDLFPGAVEATPTPAERFLLRSRFGQRLLLLFIGCALIPTCAVALLSFRSVSRQLADQSRQRLTSLAASSGKTLYDRLAFLESDMGKLAPRLRDCRECGEELSYALDGLAVVSDQGTWRDVLQGAEPRIRVATTELPAVGPGASAVLTSRTASGEARIFLIHRSEVDPRAGRVVGLIDPAYLWNSSDEEALPASVDLTIWDPASGLVVGPSGRALSVPGPIRLELSGAAQGSFETGGAGAAFATWWSLPSARRFRLPHWRIVLNEPRDEVMAPMSAFATSFPLLLVFALLLVTMLGMSQIRRSLLPLTELQKGTRRIAARDFESPVRVHSGDELEELALAFNAMTAQLGRQFHALGTAAEIDRAVLSSVDTGTIVQTVLDRVPEICPCEGLSVTILDPGGGVPGTSWIALGGGIAPCRNVTELLPADLRHARQHPERFQVGGADGPLPTYLSHFDRSDRTTSVVAFPLHYGGDLLGVLALRSAPGVPSDDLVQVRRIADQVAVALSNARMVDQVRFLAFYDSLTRLPNRVLYKERLAQSLLRAERSGRLVAILFLDLDHFSRINDTLGHDLGDLLLKEVAARLVASSRVGDSVARVGGEEALVEVSRLGGDEFTVILPELTDPQEGVRVARRLLETFRKPLRLGTQEVFVTASIGVAVYPYDGTDTEELLKSADVAMYHAKQQGRNTYQMYSASMNTEAMARMQLETQLRKAVEAEEFTIWYQPIVDLDTQETVGAEALVRWAHPERGLVSPGEFISLCEECGLIVPLGEWILRTVCAQAKTWEASGHPVRMSVNLSARQLRHEGIVETIGAILAETGLRPRALILELTESMLMEPRGPVGRTIRELADLGVSLAIDDFGTGYSSLSYLKNFPVSTLKIDRSFIADVTSNPDDAAITTAIIALARAMELDVVAEGVEREDQVAFLRERGCHKVQGYLVGRPVPPDQFETELLRGRGGRQPVAAGLELRRERQAGSADELLETLGPG